jgi:hypothetical protein
MLLDDLKKIVSQKCSFEIVGTLAVLNEASKTNVVKS